MWKIDSYHLENEMQLYFLKKVKLTNENLTNDTSNTLSAFQISL